MDTLISHDDYHLDELTQYLEEEFSKYDELDLHAKEWTSDPGACIAIGKALESNKTLKLLHLGGNRLTDKDAYILGEALKKNKTLEILDLHWNCIQNEGAKYLSEALKENKTLQVLDLGHNWIGEKGAQSLISALDVNTSCTLFVDHNETNFYKPIDEALNRLKKKYLKLKRMIETLPDDHDYQQQALFSTQTTITPTSSSPISYCCMTKMMTD